MSHFNQLANSWDTPEKILQNTKYANEVKEIISNKNPKRILEVGCGTGLLGSQFITNENFLLGIDMSTEMLKVFDDKFKNFHTRSLILNLETHDLPETQFDLIISSMAFHHLKTPLDILNKLKNHLSPNGAIAVIDLDEEDGTFHPDPKNMGVFHFGFSSLTMEKWAKLIEARSFYRKTINVIAKNNKEYPVCLSVFQF
jgi:ubiquinone/menaquinone biosynthesis C-methylase UbiE